MMAKIRQRTLLKCIIDLVSRLIVLIALLMHNTNASEGHNIYAISGADSDAFGNVYFINDDENTIYKADIHGSVSPHVKIKTDKKYNFEGVSLDDESNFWIVSEGNPDKRLDNELIKVNRQGIIKVSAILPSELSLGATKFGFEGVAYDHDTKLVWIAQQRPWSLNRQNLVNIFAFNSDGQYVGRVGYYLDNSINNEKLGLSGMDVSEGMLYLLERDNQSGDKAKSKKVYAVNIVDVDFSVDNYEVSKSLVFDFINYFTAKEVKIPEKIESLIMDVKNRRLFYATDNDGNKDDLTDLHFDWIRY